jgi:succinate dehydrogenase / fumarate reductase iron-sulfur subunit
MAAEATKYEKARLKIWRADASVEGSGEFKEYDVETYPGMVVLDAVHEIQAKQEPDLAVRWNSRSSGSASSASSARTCVTCSAIKTKRRPSQAPAS